MAEIGGNASLFLGASFYHLVWIVVYFLDWKISALRPMSNWFWESCQNDFKLIQIQSRIWKFAFNEIARIKIKLVQFVLRPMHRDRNWLQSGTIIFGMLRFYGEKCSIAEVNFEVLNLTPSKMSMFGWKIILSSLTFKCKVLILDCRISQGNRDVKRERKTAILCSRFLPMFIRGFRLRLLIRSQQTNAHKRKPDKIRFYINIFALLESNF